MASVFEDAADSSVVVSSTAAATWSGLDCDPKLPIRDVDEGVKAFEVPKSSNVVAAAVQWILILYLTILLLLGLGRRCVALELQKCESEERQLDSPMVAYLLIRKMQELLPK